MTLRAKQDKSIFELLDNDQKHLSKTTQVEKKISVSQLSYTNVSFYLRAFKTGKVKLEFVASTASIKDTIKQEIKVAPDSLLIGQRLFSYQNLTMMEKQSNFQLELKNPHSTDGVICFMTTKTEILQLQMLRFISPIDNAEQLISKLISFYYLYDYVRFLKTSKSDKWINYLQDQLNDGFQSLLRFRIPNEGFRYDNLKENGCSSTWVTGFALHAMYLLSETPVEIDNDIITETEDFLLNRRKNGTSFYDPCKIPNRRPLNELELTIEILKTLQNSNRFLKLQTSNNWVSTRLENNQNIALIAKRGASVPTWTPPEVSNPENWTIERRDLETAGRILSMQLDRKITPEPEIYTWILTKLFGQSSNCYECTMAEQAIYQRTKLLMNQETSKMKVSVYGDDIKKQNTFNLDINEELMLQEVRLQAKENVINFKADGLGQLLVQCHYEYEVMPNNKSEPKDYHLRLKRVNAINLPPHKIKAMFCVWRHTFGRENYIGSEVIIDLPSGYTLDRESIDLLSLKPEVRVS